MKFASGIASVLFSIVGCSGGSAPNPDTGDVVPSENIWQACALVEGGSNDAECARVSLPQSYNRPSGLYEVWVKRLRAASPARGQLWLLAGGPGGGATATLAQRMADVATLVDDLDIYTFDHRGSGHSGRLSCPEQEDAASDGGVVITEVEWVACLSSLQSGEVELDDVTTTAAAWDLGELIEQTREPGDVMFVWGISYGTYHAQRYLQLFPEQPTGVILEAIAPAGTMWSEFDQRFSEVARSIVELCVDDPGCESRLGSDPWSYMSQARTIVDSGQCNLGIDGATWGQLLGLLLYDYALREVVPALAYRATRCSADDLSAYARLFSVLGGSGTGLMSVDEQGPNSIVLFNHVWSSEGWPSSGPPPLTQLQAVADACVLCLGSGPRLAARYADWPRYDAFPYDDVFANFGGPMLMMHGALDPATPLDNALVMQTRYAAPNQHFVTFPTGGHGLSGRTPTIDGDCAYTIYMAFLRDPAASLDTSCIGQVRPLNFDGDPAIVELLLGTPDLWGD